MPATFLLNPEYELKTVPIVVLTINGTYRWCGGIYVVELYMFILFTTYWGICIFVHFSPPI